jgi:CRISPR-associated protein Cmr1
MREKEARLFGSAAGNKGQASPLIIEVEPVELGQEKHPFYLEPGKNFPKNRPEITPGYVAFPLQSNNQDPTNYPVRVGVRFRMCLRYPDWMKEEIEAALWAWEHFGGLGGRTRRGFGAVWPEGVSPPTEQALKAEWSRYVRSGKAPEGVPSLSGARYRVVELSWRKVVELYQKFRQSRNPGQQPGRPGRSHWPEPDAIRSILKLAAARHRQPILQPPILKFPRAQFGLPIIFHFKDTGDPSTRIVPAKRDIERLASPLIFRPLDDKRCVVLVLTTPRTPPGGAALERGGEVASDLTREEAKRIIPLKGEPDPLLAFLNLL